MKKWIKESGLMLLAMLIVSLLLSTMVFASGGIKVLVNGEPVQFDVQPQLINDRTMVPLRAIFEKLGATVEWYGDTETIIARRDGIEVISVVGSKLMYVNGERKTMDVAPTVINGRTLVPARFVAEAFDCFVEWDGGSRTVYVESNYGMDDDDSANVYENFTEEEIYKMFE